MAEALREGSPTVSQYLVAIPNVSAPDVQCGTGLVGIFDHSIGRWTCLDASTPCPFGTTLYFSPGPGGDWRFCTPDVTYATALHGASVVTPTQSPVAAVPTLSGWALGALLLALAFFGARRLG